MPISSPSAEAEEFGREKSGPVLEGESDIALTRRNENSRGPLVFFLYSILKGRVKQINLVKNTPSGGKHGEPGLETRVFSPKKREDLKELKFLRKSVILEKIVRKKTQKPRWEGWGPTKKSRHCLLAISLNPQTAGY